MRGETLSFAENYQATYYDLISTKVVNGVKKYDYDTMPQTFSYAETSLSGATVFQSTKGFETSSVEFGGVYQTNSYKYKIQTSNTQIDFKVNGKVKMIIDGEEKTFTIIKVTYLTAYLKGLSGKRPFVKGNSLKSLPRVLDLS